MLRVLSLMAGGLLIGAGVAGWAQAAPGKAHVRVHHSSAQMRHVGGVHHAAVHPRRNEVNHRLGHQASRIHQGVHNGKLTPTQANQLQANDSAIKQQERSDVTANGGYLTKPEQRQLNQEENANSKLIRDEKHPVNGSGNGSVSNGNPANPTGGTFAEQHPRRNEVNSRLTNQGARINEGVQSGKLTPTQANQLGANDSAIKQQERTDVKANGGFLTKPEQRQLNQEENANSKLIRDEKHPAPK